MVHVYEIIFTELERIRTNILYWFDTLNDNVYCIGEGGGGG